MDNKRTAAEIAAPYFGENSKHEKLYVTSDGQVFTEAHLADGHAQRLADRKIEIVCKGQDADVNGHEVVLVPDVADRPILVPRTDEVIGVNLAPAAENITDEPLGADNTGSAAKVLPAVEPLVNVESDNAVIQTENVPTTESEIESLVDVKAATTTKPKAKAKAKGKSK